MAAAVILPAMETNQNTGRLVRTMAASIALAILAAGCVASETTNNANPNGSSDGTAAQPRMATYSCGEDGSITVESLGNAVRVLGTDGASIDLPASPPSQNARFGGSNQAIVLEGGEALYMVSGKPTLSCQRS
ncbi:hypothetical protein JYU29_16190 [Tianweitania sp. BSSL-BM11]|uniref:C-type lysozyme inhibitor domain-containing protein n=1 Tax=Tianweitania aestuarii TaxID=2814886 RepID=A0ABS5RYV2_9HYPH|nr:hypothetical protein [Tianweitania aestuarii]MBS9722235.1 hypothetical protein [Tianweitania aestuarii]